MWRHSKEVAVLRREENGLHEQLNPTSIVTLDFIFRPVWKQLLCFSTPPNPWHFVSSTLVA